MGAYGAWVSRQLDNANTRIEKLEAAVLAAWIFADHLRDCSVEPCVCGFNEANRKVAEQVEILHQRARDAEKTNTDRK